MKKNNKKSVTRKNTESKTKINWKLVKKIILVVIIVACASIAVWNTWANTIPELNVITVTEKNLPADFDGYRIAHISDFHSTGKMTDKVINLLRDAKPDIICITGDLMDSRDTNPDVALDFIEKAMEIAQCYFVTGNHELLVPRKLMDTLLEGMADRGVILLDKEILQCGDSEIILIGDFFGTAKDEEYMYAYDGYRIFASHYPENMDYFVAAKYDLVLAGHAHGGQVRLPLVGGLYAPGQGVFPEYDAGLYSQGDTDMILNRGIGNSTIPFRFNNRPEVVLVELKCAK